MQALGAALTLIFCPQFGVGIPEGHGITHLRTYGDWACAGFCGTLFLLAGNFLASLFMNNDEYYWIWRRYKIELIFVPALFWASLMLFNLTWKLNSETISYHLVWLISAIFAQEFLMYMKTKNYNGILRKIA